MKSLKINLGEWEQKLDDETNEIEPHLVVEARYPSSSSYVYSLRIPASPVR
jgi:hypothetical protein